MSLSCSADHCSCDLCCCSQLHAACQLCLLDLSPPPLPHTNVPTVQGFSQQNLSTCTHSSTAVRRLGDDFVQGDPALPTEPPQPRHWSAVPALCGSERRTPGERCALLVGGAEVQGKRLKVGRCVSALAVYFLCLLSLTLKGLIHSKLSVRQGLILLTAITTLCLQLMSHCFILQKQKSTDQMTLLMYCANQSCNTKAPALQDWSISEHFRTSVEKPLIVQWSSQ